MQFRERRNFWRKGSDFRVIPHIVPWNFNCSIPLNYTEFRLNSYLEFHSLKLKSVNINAGGDPFGGEDPVGGAGGDAGEGAGKDAGGGA